MLLLDLSNSFGGAILHEPQPYVPSNPIHENDIERLLSVESEVMEGSWSRVKKTKDAEVWRRDSNEEGFPPITKVWVLWWLLCRLALFSHTQFNNLYSLTFAIQWHMQTCIHPILGKLDIITNFLKAASSAVIYIMRGAFLYHSHCFNASLNFFPRLCYNWKMFLLKKVSNS